MSNETHETLVRLAQRIMDSEAGAARPAQTAAAPTAPAAETPGQAYERERQQQANELAGTPPGGEVTREQLKTMTANEIAALPQSAVDAALAGGRS